MQESFVVRVLFAVVLFLVGAACTKARQPVAIETVSATVPGAWVPLAPERLTKLRDSAMSSDPSVDVSMVGRKPPDEPMPWMYLQRAEMRPQVVVPLNVGTLLERTASELKTTMTDSGLSVVSATTTVVGDTHELCVVAKSVPKSEKGAPVLSHTCMRLWVSEKTRKVHTASVVCLSLADEPAECEKIIASRTHEPGAALSMASLYEP